MNSGRFPPYFFSVIFIFLILLIVLVADHIAGTGIFPQIARSEPMPIAHFTF
jgi:hypothetical protein